MNLRQKRWPKRVGGAVALLAVAVPGLWLGAASVPAAAPSTGWQPILATLNQSFPTPSPPVYSHSLEHDLLKLNEEELREIQKDWGVESSHRRPGRLERNRFFHQQVLRLNDKALGPLRRALSRGRGQKSHRFAIEKVLRAAAVHPVARVENVDRFQEGGQIGFCFGRALLVHHLLLKEGVPQKDIAKIFALGQLRVGGVFWRFHVGVLVRDPKVGYIVIDPLQDRWLPFAEWTGVASGYGIKTPLSRVRFYVTDPRKFLPAFGAYHLAQLEDPLLREYFAQLVQSLNP